MILNKTAIIFDFDGTLFDTMKAHADLASEVIARHFHVSKEFARRTYLQTAGMPFVQQLEKIFPTAEPTTRQQCAQEYAGRKAIDVYRAAKIFKDVKQTLSGLKKKGFELYISSSTEEDVIRTELKRLGLSDFFSQVFGMESGTKMKQVEKLIKLVDGEGLVVFVGDTAHDVALSKGLKQVITIGRAGIRKKGLRGIPRLYQSGADLVVKDLRLLLHVDFQKIYENRFKVRKIIRKSRTKNPYPQKRILSKRASRA